MGLCVAFHSAACRSASLAPHCASLTASTRLVDTTRRMTSNATIKGKSSSVICSQRALLELTWAAIRETHLFDNPEIGGVTAARTSQIDILYNFRPYETEIRLSSIGGSAERLRPRKVKERK